LSAANSRSKPRQDNGDSIRWSMCFLYVGYVWFHQRGLALVLINQTILRLPGDKTLFQDVPHQIPGNHQYSMLFQHGNIESLRLSDTVSLTLPGSINHCDFTQTLFRRDCIVLDKQDIMGCTTSLRRRSKNFPMLRTKRGMRSMGMTALQLMIYFFWRHEYRYWNQFLWESGSSSCNFHSDGDQQMLWIKNSTVNCADRPIIISICSSEFGKFSVLRWHNHQKIGHF
jgi:hypothetical protein